MKETARCDVFIRAIRVIRGLLRRFLQPLLGCGREPALSERSGINVAAVDVWKTPPATGPRTDLKTFEADLRFFVAECRRTGAMVLLLTPNPLQWADVTRKLISPDLPHSGVLGVALVNLDGGGVMHVYSSPNGYGTKTARTFVACRVTHDGGRTWLDRVKVFAGYSRATNGAMQTETGRLLVPDQRDSPEDAAASIPRHSRISTPSIWSPLIRREISPNDSPCSRATRA